MYYSNRIRQVCWYSDIMDRDRYLEMERTYAKNSSVKYMYELLSAKCYALKIHGLSVNRAKGF